MLQQLRVWFSDKLRNRMFFRSVLVLAGSTALIQSISVLASPILSRLYTPSDFGTVSVYSSLLSILVAVSSMRYELAIPLARKDEDGANLAALSTLVLLLTATLIWLGILWAGDTLVDWINVPIMISYLWLLPLGVLGQGFFQILHYWMVRKKNFSYLARGRVAQSVSQVTMQLGLGIAGTQGSGMLLGKLFGLLVGVLRLFGFIAQTDIKDFRKINKEKVKAVAYRYRRFPLISSSSALLNTMGLKLTSILLSAFYSPEIVGWFSMGQRLVGIPVSLVSQSVAQVYLGEAPRLANRDLSALRSLFFKTASRLCLIGIMVIVLPSIGGPWIFSFIFGESWRTAGIYLRLLSLAFMGRFVVTPLSQTLNILERQDLQLAWDIVRLVVVVGSLSLSRYLNVTPTLSIAIYSVSMFVSYLLLFFLMVSVLKKR
jgi:O-antigen/teichoic acid export membrane protein